MNFFEHSSPLIGSDLRLSGNSGCQIHKGFALNGLTRAASREAPNRSKRIAAVAHQTQSPRSVSQFHHSKASVRNTLAKIICTRRTVSQTTPHLMSAAPPNAPLA